MHGTHLLLAVACIAGAVPFGTLTPVGSELLDTYTCIKKACMYERCDSETVCTVNGTNGCVKTVVHVLGALFSEQGCSSTPCVPSYLDSLASTVENDCCFSEKCNTDSMTSTSDNPEIDECYSAVCEGGRRCVRKAVDDGNARLCPLPEGGICRFTYVFGETNTGIAECLEDASNCTSGAIYDMNEKSGNVSQCCYQDGCNNGSMEKIPDVDYCYSLTCTGKECIREAIQNNIFLYCAQEGFGCVTEENSGTYVTGCSSQQCDDCCFGDLCNGPAGESGIESTTIAVGSTNSRDFFDGFWTNSFDYYFGSWTTRFGPPTQTEAPVLIGTGRTDTTGFYNDFWTERFIPSSRTEIPVPSGTDRTEDFYNDIWTDSPDYFYEFFTNSFGPPTQTEAPVLVSTGRTDTIDFYNDFWTERFIPSSRTEMPVPSGTDRTEDFYNGIWTDSPDYFYSFGTDKFVSQTQITTSTQTPVISGSSTEKSADTSVSMTARTSAPKTTKTLEPKTVGTLAPETAGTSKPKVTTPKTVKSSTRRSVTNSPTKGTDTSIVSGASKPRSFTSLMSLLHICFGSYYFRLR